MNIGIITTWYPAGAGYVSKNFEKLLFQKHNVYIYARGGKIMKGDSNWDSPNVEWAPKYWNGINIKHLINWAKEKEIEVLFFNEQRYWKPILVAKQAGIKVGAYIDYYKEETVPLFAIYDFLICNTQKHFSVFNWHPSCHFIPWGVDLNDFKPIQKKISVSPTFLISAGWEGKYLSDRRGSILALKAFKEVIGNCCLKVYSQVELNSCSEEFKNLIYNDTRIEFHFGTFEPFPFEEGDVYVYPSRLEGIGLSLPEAIASGLPSITTDAAPMNEFVKTGVNGTLVEVEKFVSRSDGYYWPQSICKHDNLVSALQKYVDNPGLIKSQSGNAIEFAKNKLDWSKNRDMLLEIFENCKLKNREVDFSLLTLLKKSDRSMAPSILYKIISPFRDYLVFKFLSK
jgi:1,2-diacylglycerol 3-alpha-glucosyltransferase